MFGRSHDGRFLRPKAEGRHVIELGVLGVSAYGAMETDDPSTGNMSSDAEQAPFVEHGIQVYSDLHLEFKGARAALPPIIPRAPVVALLGDIGIPSLPSYEEFIFEMSDIFKQVLVVSGNHEYYSNLLLVCMRK